MTEQDAPQRPERHRISTPLEEEMWAYIGHLEAGNAKRESAIFDMAVVLTRERERIAELEADRDKWKGIAHSARSEKDRQEVRIDRLEAEIERLVRVGEKYVGECDRMAHERSELRAEIERLKAVENQLGPQIAWDQICPRCGHAFKDHTLTCVAPAEELEAPRDSTIASRSAKAMHILHQAGSWPEEEDEDDCPPDGEDHDWSHVLVPPAGEPCAECAHEYNSSECRQCKPPDWSHFTHGGEPPAEEDGDDCPPDGEDHDWSHVLVPPAEEEPQ